MSICKKWSLEEDSLIKMIYPTTHNEDIVKFFPGRCRDTIKQRACHLKITKLDDYDGSHIYNVNHSFFSDTTNSSYVAGFIAADGHLSKTRYMISIMLSKKDNCILENIKKIMDSNGPIKTTTRNNREIVEMHIYSRTCVKDLYSNFNIPQGRKTKRIKPPNLTNSNDIINFIVGLIDGDGSICCGFRKGKARKDGSRNKECYFSLYLLGTKPLLSWIEKFIRKNIPYNKTDNKNKKKIQKMKGTYRLNLTGLRGLVIAEYLRDNSVSYKLNRKWNKIAEYIKLRKEWKESKLAN